MRTATPILILLLWATSVPAEVAAPSTWLVVPDVDKRGRRPFNPDRIFARYLLDPAAAPPRAGETVGGRTWAAAAVDEKGRLAGSFAYAYATVASDRDRVVRATLRGAGALFVNGDGFAGAVYRTGYATAPVLLRKGENRLFVRGTRRGFTLRLDAVDPGVHVRPEDATFPDVVPGGKAPAWAGVLVVNAATKHAPLPVGADAWGLAPLGVRRPAFECVPAPEIEVAGVAFRLDERTPGDPRRITFRSRIDGSAQYYAVRAPTGDGPAGLVLTLHGAGVEARRQAACYASRPDLWIVAPTNRREFGFDWQDWGRTDAYEALEHALAWTGADRARLYLTGHSMGGHGAWHVGANDPDGWAAIAPCAGWPSFDTYGGRPVQARDQPWRGADLASFTRALVPNLKQLPTFVLHGAADKTVPPEQARMMIKALTEAGAPPRAHFEDGKGHWYDGPASKGVDCVDWPGIFDLFREHRRRDDPDEIEFLTVDPGVDSRHHWVEVLQPSRYGEHARIKASRTKGGIVIETRNVSAFRVLGGPMECVVDGSVVVGRSFVRTHAGWRAGAPAEGGKSPALSGPFKRAFDRGFVLVYGQGDAEALARARYDAQVWAYRANGDAPVVSDRVFLAAPSRGNVILYGNEDTNSAFAAVLRDGCPVEVRAGEVRAGAKRFLGDGIGCVFVYPRAGGGLVGVFGHTGPKGARLGYGLLPFVSGVGYPDYAVFDATFLEAEDEGVLAAGWFDRDWRLP